MTDCDKRASSVIGLSAAGANVENRQPENAKRHPTMVRSIIVSLPSKTALKLHHAPDQACQKCGGTMSELGQIWGLRCRQSGPVGVLPHCGITTLFPNRK